MNCYGLNWNIGHLTFAAYAADAIICHNIWLGGKTEKEEYTQYGLTPLVYTRTLKTSFLLKNSHYNLCCAY